MSVQSIRKAIDILSLFSITRPHLGITEISKSIGMPKATAHGIVKTLVEQGFLIQDAENNKYSLGLRIYELGMILSGTLKINLVGLGPARRLAQNRSTMVRLGLWDRESVFVTMNRFPSSDVTQTQFLGPRIPAHCTALGKSILAFLPKEQIRDYLKHAELSAYTPRTIVSKKALLDELEDIVRIGYATDNQEYVSGHCCIGAPIYDRMGNPIAAVSLSVQPPDLIRKLPSSLVDDLIEISIEISMSMGYVPGTASRGITRKAAP
ncbi:MAG: IclR family transcriptional regulator [Deltaproteobacteria bacterium]|nr:IclR family transcriptional regulator [Candidatus Zymogenaceae bacterium]